MPSSSGYAPLNQPAIGFGVQRDAPLVSSLVAEPATRDDVGGLVVAAITTSDEVLGGALHGVRLARGSAIAVSE
jgi:hypothetical protein